MRVDLGVTASILLASSARGFAPTGRVHVQHHVNPLFAVNSPRQWSSLPGCTNNKNQRPKTMLREASSSATESSKPKKKGNPIVAVVNFFAINEAFRSLCIKYAITFPASLSGCGALFATFLFAPFGGTLYDQFAPGAAVLAKWLPVFFVPSLIALPLADSVGSATEVAGVVIGGFLFTLLTTAYSVLAVRKLMSTDSAEPTDEAAAEVTTTPGPAPKAFSDKLSLSLQAISAGSALLTIIAKKNSSSAFNPLATIFMLSTTLSTFVFGARLPKKFTKIVHPLVTCTGLTWFAINVVGKLTGESFRSMLVAYSAAGGAGKILYNFLGPAVISLACQMYDRRKLMKENMAEVATAIGVSSVGGLFGTAAVVRLLRIAGSSLRLSLLSRNITSPLAMAIAGILGADISLAVSMVVVTGLFGANFGASILDAVGIKDAVARGLGIGAAAHGLGTAAFANEQDAFPFAAIAMALTASACTVLVSVPFIKQVLLKVALG